MFSKPINLDTEPFPFRLFNGLLGNFTWQTMKEFRSTKLIPIALIQLGVDVGIVALMVFLVLIILLFDGDLASNGIIAWISSAIVTIAMIVVAKRLLRELVAMYRLLRAVRQKEKIQQQKLNDLRIHL